MRPLFLFIAFLTIASPIAFAADAEWKAGVAVVRITPQKPVRMAGYGGRNKPFETVTQDLYAKALALEDRDGTKAVLVTTDLESMTAKVAAEIAARIGEKYGLKREQIVLNWSHTHAGPYVSLKLEVDTGMTPENAQDTIDYTRWLQDRVVEVAGAALAKLEPAKLSWGTGVANFVMNRREFTATGVILGVNPRGFVDRSVPVLRVDSPEGKARVALFGCACHNTTLGAKNMSVCGDYAGFAQSNVESHEPGVVAMFMQNCGGNANPYPRDTMDLARQHGDELGMEVRRALGTKLQPLSGPLRMVFDNVALPLQPTTHEDLEKIAAQKPRGLSINAPQMLGILKKGGTLPTHYRAPVAVWQFGNDLTLVALSGEVMAEYALRIEKAVGPLRLWVAAYCNDDFGYLPTAQVIREGGYETRGLNEGNGWFAPSAEDALVERVRELAKKAGRKVSD